MLREMNVFTLEEFLELDGIDVLTFIYYAQRRDTPSAKKNYEVFLEWLDAVPELTIEKSRPRHSSIHNSCRFIDHICRYPESKQSLIDEANIFDLLFLFEVSYGHRDYAKYLIPIFKDQSFIQEFAHSAGHQLCFKQKFRSLDCNSRVLTYTLYTVPPSALAPSAPAPTPTLDSDPHGTSFAETSSAVEKIYPQLDFEQYCLESQVQPSAPPLPESSMDEETIVTILGLIQTNMNNFIRLGNVYLEYYRTQFNLMMKSLETYNTLPQISTVIDSFSYLAIQDRYLRVSEEIDTLFEDFISIASLPQSGLSPVVREILNTLQTAEKKMYIVHDEIACSRTTIHETLREFRENYRIEFFTPSMVSEHEKLSNLQKDLYQTHIYPLINKLKLLQDILLAN